jgi:predicted dehydrogenase
MGIRIGICGTGAFARHFIPLFQHHPEVEQVVLADLDAEKLAAKSAEYGLPETLPDLDALCAADLDAIALFTQHHIHAPQAVQALRAGKHVYSAVPIGITVEQVEEVVRATEQSGRIYMIGETSYYYPAALYCRERFRRGDFGYPVYGEAEYYHDYAHGMHEVLRWRHGEAWKRYAGMPPFFYPTHSVSLIVSVTGARVTHVSGQGVVDQGEDRLWHQPDSVWEGEHFSNETMLARMSDGSAARFSEFRRVGHPGRVGLRLYGSEASYEDQIGSRIWVTRNRQETVDLADLLATAGVPADRRDEMAAVTAEDGTHKSASRIHPVAALPAEYVGLPNGHEGSHQFLIHEFVSACAGGRHPANNAWQAARYCLPGLVAHQSARRGGELLAVPDLGAGPEEVVAFRPRGLSG